MNRILLKIIAFTCLLFFASSAIASTRVYIYAKVDIFDNEIFIEDIASVENNNGDIAKKIEKTAIPRSLIKNNFLDARVLADYLKQIGYNDVRIYGNSVRINMISNRADIVDPITFKEDIDEILVKANVPVRVVLNKNKIRVGITGKALKEGRSGDDIPVRIRDKVIYCKVVGSNLVEKE